MSRRKHLAARKPCGRLYPVRDTELMSPAEARRLIDAAAAGLRDQVWGTTIGRLYLDGKITLRLAGIEAERVVDHVCARDQALAGFGELNALQRGLDALAALWNAKRKASAR